MKYKKIISILMLVLVLTLLALPLTMASAQSGQPPTGDTQTVPVEAGQIMMALLSAVITVFIPIVGTWLKAWVDQHIEKAKSATNTEKYNMARGIIYDLVQSAKQRGLNGEILNEGTKLKAYVIGRGAELFAQYNLPFDVDTIVDMLESAYTTSIAPAKEVIDAELNQSAPTPTA